VRLNVRAVLIINPASGGGGKAEDVRELASQYPWIEIRETRSPGDIERLTRAACDEGADAVLVAGGDGAVSEAMDGISACARPAKLGIVPAGTGNDFAGGLGIPPDPERALEIIAAGRTIRADIMRLKKAGAEVTRLLNAVSGGISSALDEKMDKEMKGRWGRLAYVVAALRSLADVAMYEVLAVLDGEEIRARACAVLVANGPRAGGQELVSPADVTDHFLDVVIVTAETLAQRALLAAAFLAGTHLEADGVIFRRARKVRIEAEPRMAFHGDGEDVGETPIELEVVPGAVEIFVPAEEKG
jgi:diacylglycerol kinase (ATP)